MPNTKSNKILLIMPYLEKGPGVRHLANYLQKNGFEVVIVFLKELQSLFKSNKITEEELSLLKKIIQKEEFLFVGLSIHSSLVIHEISGLIDMLKNEPDVLFVTGGVFPSIAPEECAKFADIVMRGEGEIAIVRLANAIKNGEDWTSIPNLSYINEKGIYIQNDLERLVQDLDTVAYPIIGNKNIYLIDNNKISNIDPQLNTEFYEISGSRGCPFNCSFCCSSNMRKIYKGKGDYLRFRSVDSVISELTEALQKNNKIKVIRFWDEVFTTDMSWIRDFCTQYKQKINLPFHIWGHPSMIKDEVIAMLKDIGLHRIVVGFQSGSPHIRNNIFNRPETNEQIINASKIISSHSIPEVYYDLMICHPLETLEELKETFYLCMQLEPPFVYELHQLAYQPGSAIINLIIEKGIHTKDELERIFHSPFDQQNINFLEPIQSTFTNQPEKKVWADLIYLTQFPDIRPLLLKLAQNPELTAEKINELKNEKQSILSEKARQTVVYKEIDNKKSLISILMKFFKRR